MIACQAVYHLQERQRSTAESAYPKHLKKPVPAASQTPAVTASPTETVVSPAATVVTPTHTVVSPTLTPALTSLLTPSPTPLSQALQLRIFDELWNAVKDEYLYPDFNGLDWEAIYIEYQQRIQDGLSNAEFYEAMDEMIMRLGDDHSVFLSPSQVAEEDAEYQGEYDYVGVGVMLSAIPDRQRAVILVTFPGSPAEKAGLKPRDCILAVNNEPILDEYGFLKDIVRGPEGTQVNLTVESPGQTPREMTLTRQRITSDLPVPYTTLTSTQGQRIGYIFLFTFTDIGMPDQVGNALEALSAGGALDGLIIDNTQNSGGADTVLKPILAYFTQGTLGYFISRDEKRPLEIKKSMDIAGSTGVPLVVLIGLDTISYGEVFAGVLQDTGRAHLIGETTGGNVETLWSYDFEDGSRAWLAHESFLPVIHPDQNWEQTGIIPDQTIIANWDEYATEDDPRVKAALDYFDQLK
jgi:carboxyl-terminal processing protease